MVSQIRNAVYKGLVLAAALACIGFSFSLLLAVPDWAYENKSGASQHAGMIIFLAAMGSLALLRTLRTFSKQ